MVRAAAAANRVLLERAQPGRRLAGVEDRRAGARDRVDVAARERGDSGEAAEEIERRALAGEDRARGARDAARSAGRLRDAVAVGGERLELDVGSSVAEDRVRSRRARRRRPAP